MGGRLIVVLVALLAALGVTAHTASAGGAACPDTSFLRFENLVYASEPVAAGVTVEAGPKLGTGEIDRPRPGQDDPCERERITLDVLSVAGLEQPVVVLVGGSDGIGFVLGARCSGYTASARWECALNPLQHAGVSYTAVAYPEESEPRGALTVGDPLGEGLVGDAPVQVVAIDGVDPALAVAIEGRPSEAFVAPGVCPYERLDSDPALDDLRTCLTSPVWFTFAPLGGEAGAVIKGTADRPAPAELDGAIAALMQLSVAADTLPAQQGAVTPLSELAVDAAGVVALDFEIPDLDEGIYEVVITCSGCAAKFGGATRFASGSIIVLGGGSSGARIVTAAVVVVLLSALGVGFMLWRRGRGRRIA